VDNTSRGRAESRPVREVGFQTVNLFDVVKKCPDGAPSERTVCVSPVPGSIREEEEESEGQLFSHKYGNMGM
jgi:hypothetical protein